MMKVSIVIFAFLTVALGLALEAADAADTTGAFNDPMSYCKAVGAIDAPDAKYTAVPDWMVAALYTPQEIKAQKSSGVDPKRAVVWRCMGLRARQQPDLRQGEPSNTPTKAMREFCASQPNAEVIPLSVIGHENPMIYDWACKGKEPTVTRQIFKVDAQGYPSELWKQIAPGGK
jgi:hypothetical protein